MKWLLSFWGGPVLFLFVWYGLSYYDISFGIFMLSREAHDLVFRIYGQILGLPPESIPPLVAKAIILDSLIVCGLFLFGRRMVMMKWWKRRQSSEPDAILASDDNLSSAP